MAVSIQSKSGDLLLLQVAEFLGPKSKAQALALHQMGYALSLQPKWLQVTKNGSPAAQEHLNTSVIPLLLDHKLAEHSEKALVGKIESLMQSAVAKADLNIPNAVAEPAGFDEPAVENPAAAKKGPPVVAAAEQLNAVTGAAYHHNLKATVGNLSTANKLHQPVRGSGAETRYFVVGLGDGLNLAARLILNEGNDTWGLTVRAQGPKFHDHEEVLTRVGITVKGEYASLHLSGPGGRCNLLKALGALVTALDLPMTLASGNGRLINMGS